MRKKFGPRDGRKDGCTAPKLKDGCTAPKLYIPLRFHWRLIIISKLIFSKDLNVFPYNINSLYEK
jgi:hypothetical protein